MKKTISYATLHFSVAFSVTWLLTGDLLVGGLVALIEPTINTVAYFFHEKVWARIESKHDTPSSSTSIATMGA